MLYIIPIVLAIVLPVLPFLPYWLPSLKKLAGFLYNENKGYAWYLHCIGVFLAGFTASIAVYRSNDIYQQVLEVQSQAKTINDGVEAIKNILVQQASVKISSRLPDKPKLTEAEVEKVLSEIPDLTGSSGVYLPKEVKTQVTNELVESPRDMRESILQQYLKYDTNKKPSAGP